MAEKSIMWSTGALGDGAAAYTMAEITAWLRRTLGITGAIHPGHGNVFAPTVAAPNVSIDTGAATVYGYPYESDAAVLVNIPNPVGATRIDRIVLRADWATQTVRITRIAGAEGAGVPPAIVQTPGVQWDEMICQVQITFPGLAITIHVDERAYLYYRSAVNAAMIDNRTRKLFVPVNRAYNITDGQMADLPQHAAGWDFEDLHTYSGYGNFYCPSDFVSGMTVKAIVYPAGTGDCYCTHAASYGANGEAVATHTASAGPAAVAVTASQYSEIQSLSLANMAAGDHVGLSWQRAGADALDTVGATVRFQGWIVEYTADS